MDKDKIVYTGVIELETVQAEFEWILKSERIQIQLKYEKIQIQMVFKNTL